MEIKYSAEYPEKTTREGVRRTLNYNIRETTEDELQELWAKEENQGTPYDYFTSQHKYVYNTLIMGSARWSYDNVVEAIIRDKYSIDEMEAITNNFAAINAIFLQTLVNEGILAATKYLKDSYDSEKSEAFKEMQEWRNNAKKIAKEIFK